MASNPTANRHDRAALFLISLWPVLSPEEQEEWLPALETAARLNPEDGEVGEEVRRIRDAAGAPLDNSPHPL